MVIMKQFLPIWSQRVASLLRRFSLMPTAGMRLTLLLICTRLPLCAAIITGRLHVDLSMRVRNQVVSDLLHTIKLFPPITRTQGGLDRYPDSKAPAAMMPASLFFRRP